MFILTATSLFRQRGSFVSVIILGRKEREICLMATATKKDIFKIPVSGTWQQTVKLSERRLAGSLCKHLVHSFHLGTVRETIGMPVSQVFA